MKKINKYVRYFWLFVVSLWLVTLTMFILQGCSQRMIDTYQKESDYEDYRISSTDGSNYSPQVIDLQDQTQSIIWANNKSIYAQRYAGGNLVGSKVNLTNDLDFNTNFDVKMCSDGSFILTWENTSGNAIAKYGHDLKIIGDRKQISESGEKPKVAVFENGDFVVLRVINNNEIKIQRYDSDYAKLGGESSILVHNVDVNPDILALSNIDYLLVCEIGNGLKVIKSNGDNLINISTETQVWNPNIELIENDKILVAWNQKETDNKWTLYQQLFDLNGKSITSAKMVDFVSVCGSNINAIKQNETLLPAIAKLDNGYIISWKSIERNMNGDYETGIYAQKYSLTGEKNGNKLKINSVFSDHSQSKLDIVGINSNYLVVWESDGAVYAVRK